MRHRIAALQQHLHDTGISGAVLTNFTDGQPSPNFTYYTGYDGFGLLVVPAIGTATLYAPAMELGRARKSGVPARPYDRTTLTKLKFRGKVGIDFGRTDLEVWAKLRKALGKAKPVNLSPTIERLRLVKDAQELTALRRACQISDTIYAATFRRFNTFKTELDVAMFMNAEAARRGVPLAFDTIVASGPHGAIPHHKPTNAKLRGFTVIDFGVKAEGYCSDTTRTLFVGKPTRRDRACYALVLAAQRAGIIASGNDRRCAEIHRVAEIVLGAHRKRFIHSLGHGVGLEIHEAPALGPHSKHLLLDDSPYTIEPGIYFPGKFGIRIEDTLVLKHGKPQLLTRFPKELVTK